MRMFCVFFLLALLPCACSQQQPESGQEVDIAPAPPEPELAFETAQIRALGSCVENGLPFDAFLRFAVDYAVAGKPAELASLNAALARLVDRSRAAALAAIAPDSTIPARLEAYRIAFLQKSQHYCGRGLTLTVRAAHRDNDFVTLQVVDGVWGEGLPTSFPLTLSRPEGGHIPHHAAFQLTEADWQALLVAFPTKYGPARWADVGKFGAFADGFHFWRATDHYALLHESDVILPYAALAPYLTPLGRQVFGLAVEREGHEAARLAPTTIENPLP